MKFIEIISDFSLFVKLTQKIPKFRNYISKISLKELFLFR